MPVENRGHAFGTQPMYIAHAATLWRPQAQSKQSKVVHETKRNHNSNLKGIVTSLNENPNPKRTLGTRKLLETSTRARVVTHPPEPKREPELQKSYQQYWQYS